MSVTIDWNAVFNSLTVAGLVYVVRMFFSLTGAVKELRTEAKAEREIRQLQYEAVNQRIDDMRNGTVAVRH